MQPWHDLLVEKDLMQYLGPAFVPICRDEQGRYIFFITLVSQRLGEHEEYFEKRGLEKGFLFAGKLLTVDVGRETVDLKRVLQFILTDSGKLISEVEKQFNDLYFAEKEGTPRIM